MRSRGGCAYISMKAILNSIASVWNLLLLFALIGALFWFLYSFVLRRFIRLRKIASIRERRMLQEAAERDLNQK